MKIWSMTKKDLAIFFRDRGAWVWLFVLPIVFILIFAGLGSRSQSSSGDQTDERTALPVVNLDQDGDLAKRFIDGLDRAGGYRVVIYSQAEAEYALGKGKMGRYLVIPADFSANLSQGKRANLTLITHPNAPVEGTQSILQTISGVARDTSLELQILDGIRQMGAMQSASPQANQVFNTERVMAQAKSQFERSRQASLVGIVQTTPKDEAKSGLPKFDLSQTIVPGMTVLFVFLAAQTVARAIYEERKSGSLRRLVAAPLTRWQLLAGKMVPIFILVLIQIGVIFAVGSLVLPLFGFGRLGIGNDPLAWLVTSVIMALCATSLGIFIASIAKSEGQITGLSNAVLWIAGFLGGALVPAFILQSIPVLNILSRFVPHYWATTAYYDILSRGKHLFDVLPSLVALFIFSGIFFWIGTRRFSFE